MFYCLKIAKKENQREHYKIKKNGTSQFFYKIISTHLLTVAIGFYLVLSNAAEPYFQGFCGIDAFYLEAS